MNKISKDKRDKLILTALAAAMVVGLWWTFVIGAQNDRLADLTHKTGRLNESLSKAELLGRLGPIIEANLNKSRKTLETKFETMAPQKDQFYWLLRLVDQFKRPYNVDLLAITQPVEEDLGLLPKFPYKAAVFGVRMSGHYHEFGRFLADFENAFPYMAVRNLRLEPELVAPGTPAATGGGTETNSTPERLTIEFRIVTLIKPGST